MPAKKATPTTKKKKAIPTPGSLDFTPSHDKAVIHVYESREKTAAGLLIPETAKEKPQRGLVLAIGPGGRDETGKLIPTTVQVGDEILFGKFSGVETEIDGFKVLIMRDSDIMGVVNSKSKANASKGENTK